MSAVVVNPCDAQDEREAAGVSETAFVITCNDMVEAVVFGKKEQAQAIKDRLSKEYFERYRDTFIDRHSTPEEIYRVTHYWDVHETRLILGGAL